MFLSLFLGATLVASFDYNNIYHRITRSNNMTNPPLILVVDNPSFNASYWNGKIRLYTGLLRGVKNSDELAFVIGHELGHHFGISFSSHAGEYKADKLAMQFLRNAGIDACHGAQVLKRLKGGTSTHPRGADRYQRTGCA